MGQEVVALEKGGGGVGTLLRTMYGKTANSLLGTELCRMKGLTFPKILEMVR